MNRKQYLKMSLEEPFKVLLIGNGLWRAIDGKGSDTILEEMRVRNNCSVSKEDFKKLNISFPQKVVVATNDGVNRELKYLSAELINSKIAEEDYAFIKSIMNKTDAEAILTTNYSYEIERSVIENFNRNKYNAYRKNSYKEFSNKVKEQLYQYIDLNAGGIRAPLWHIHGEAYRPTSMVFGHYYYGKMLGYIQQEAQAFLVKKEIMKKKEIKEISIRSWVDYFLCGNVHIIGFSCDPAEMDIWWLINFKKIHFPNTHIYYHDIGMNEYALGKKCLMDSYGVIYLIEDPSKFMEGDKLDYRSYYISEIKKIANN